MKLSQKTFNALSSALCQEVINYIHEDERYAEFMMELIPDAIVDKMGNIDEDLKMELAFSIMEQICFKVSN